MLYAVPLPGELANGEGRAHRFPAAQAAAGRDGIELSPTRRGGVRLDEYGPALPLPAGGLSEQSLYRRRIPRFQRRLRRGPPPLAGRPALVCQGVDAQERRQARRAEIAIPPRPRPCAPRDIPRGAVRPHCPRPLPGVSLGCEHGEALLSAAGLPEAA